MADRTSHPTWLLGNHLGSTSMVADDTGDVLSEVKYSAFGEIRYDSGTTPTDYLYTGQRQEAEVGLYYYVARWYDPSIGRFIQADSVVPNPGSALGFDRFAYVGNNPLKYIDPSGHVPCMDGDCSFLGGRLPDRPRILPTSTATPTPEPAHPSVAVFGGSYGQGFITEPGPQTLEEHLTAWAEDIDGGNVDYWVPYPGSKSEQSSNALEMDLPKDESLALICYSAGTEACLMFATAFKNADGDVHSIVLLGPTFDAHNELGEYQGSEYWLNEMNNLIADGVNVSVIHDSSGGAAGEHFIAPTNRGGGEYKYWDRRNTPHFSFGYPGYASNNNPNLRDQVYSWITSLIQ